MMIDVAAYNIGQLSKEELFGKRLTTCIPSEELQTMHQEITDAVCAIHNQRFGLSETFEETGE